MEQSILIVGLGNIGKEYENTRHNVGFRILDQIAEKNAASFQKKRDLKGEISRFHDVSKVVTLLKPSTYMNLSGESLRKVLDFYKIGRESLLIITDDVDLPIGQLRLRSSGSSGGHNGLKSVETHLGTKDYYRLKIGVGRQPGVSLADFVLGNFTQEEQNSLKEVFEIASEVVKSFVKGGYQEALNFLANTKYKKQSNIS